MLDLSFLHHPDLGLLALRIVIGLIFIVHGLDKLPLWKMKASPELPAPMLGLLRFLSIVEPLGGLATVAGILTELAALGFIIVMIGAILTKSFVWKSPFIAMNKPGWDLDFAVLGGAITLLLLGAGSYTLATLI